VRLIASILNGIWVGRIGLLDDLWIDPPQIADGFITGLERAAWARVQGGCEERFCK